MKDFGTDSTAINSPTRKSNGTKDTKKSHSAQPQGVAKFSALGDEAFKKKDHEAAVNYYMQSIRLLTPKNPDEGQLDLKHCKKNSENVPRPQFPTPLMIGYFCLI